MVSFAKAYPEFAIGQQVVAQIPWGHNILLLQKLGSLEERIWYAEKTIIGIRIINNDNKRMSLLRFETYNK